MPDQISQLLMQELNQNCIFDNISFITMNFCIRYKSDSSNVL